MPQGTVAKVGFTALIPRHQLPTGTLDLCSSRHITKTFKTKGSLRPEPLRLYDGFQSQEHLATGRLIPSAGQFSSGSLPTTEGAYILK